MRSSNSSVIGKLEKLCFLLTNDNSFNLRILPDGDLNCDDRKTRRQRLIFLYTILKIKVI